MGETTCRWHHISKIYEQLIQLNIQKMKNSVTKWAEDPNRHFSKEDTDGQQAHEKMLNIRERPILYVVTYIQELKNKQTNEYNKTETHCDGRRGKMAWGTKGFILLCNSTIIQQIFYTLNGVQSTKTLNHYVVYLKQI